MIVLGFHRLFECSHERPHFHGTNRHHWILERHFFLKGHGLVGPKLRFHSLVGEVGLPLELVRINFRDRSVSCQRSKVIFRTFNSQQILPVREYSSAEVILSPALPKTVSRSTSHEEYDLHDKAEHVCSQVGMYVPPRAPQGWDAPQPRTDETAGAKTSLG
jgi:hypothetical protein